jgi:molecular chaperone GrpE
MADADARSEPSETPEPQGAAAPGETVEQLQGELKKLRDDLAAALAEAGQQQQEQLLRTAAEVENIRRRAARDVEQAHRFALEKFALELLPVRDSLELAAASAATADVGALAAGQEATLKLLVRAFEKFSLQVIDPRGAPFDPEKHEAMAMQPSPTAEPGSVLQVIQPGYELNGRLLRPARVIVASEPAGG